MEQVLSIGARLHVKALVVSFNSEVNELHQVATPLAHEARRLGYGSQLPHGIRRIVLDVLKPHTPRITDLALMISRDERVNGINLSLKEVDQNTESISVTIEGDDLDFESIKEILEQAGAVIHSIDQVVAGKRFVEEVTLQPENS